MTINQFAIFTMRHPNAVWILAMVCVVKLCRPVNHLEISDSRLLSIRAKSFWVSPLAFKISQIRSAMPYESSNSAFCSAGIVAKQSRKSLFCIISLNFKGCTFYVGYHILLNGYIARLLGFKQDFVKGLQIHDIATEFLMAFFFFCKGNVFTLIKFTFE